MTKEITEEEAILDLKKNRAAVPDGTLSEMLKEGGSNLRTKLRQFWILIHKTETYNQFPVQNMQTVRTKSNNSVYDSPFP